MKLGLFIKIGFIGSMVLSVLGCQNTANLNSTNTENSNISAQKDLETSASKEIPKLQNIKFESADKVEIVGTFYESPKEKSPAVLLLHQFGSERHSYDEFAERLQKKGFGVLAIDGRGFGESVKTTSGETVPVSRSDEAVKGMKADVINAYNFLARQKNVDPSRIGIVGASYGSSLAIIFAAEHKNVKAIALLSPGLNYFGNMPTEPAVKSYGDRPLLMVAAEDDKASADSVRKLKEAGVSEKYEVKIYEKGGHGTNIFRADVGLQDLLEGFLTKSL